MDDASHREVLATQYNAFARAYQRNVNEEPLWRHSTTHTYRKLILRNGPLDNKTVLDIACGEGVLSRFCADSRAARVVGVDSSSEMIRLANDSVPETHAGVLAFETHDATQLDAARLGGPFDLAIAVHLFCYAEDADQLRSMVRSAASCLKPGGHLVGVRECYSETARGPTPQRCACSHGKLSFSWSVDEKSYPRDFAACHFCFGNSDGSAMQFVNHAVADKTMLQMFDEAGLTVVEAGRLLEWNPDAPSGLFPKAFTDALIDDFGSIMWFFDCVKR